jgi:uncharacterized membrane protein
VDYRYLLLAHLLGFALFLIGHGVSMFFTAALRRERHPDRLRALLDLSLSSLVANYLGLLLLIVSGIWMAFAAGFWGQGWIWTAIVILVLEMALMIFMGVTYFGRIRTAVGLQPYRSTRQVPLGPVASPDELDRLLRGRQPGIVMGVGLLGLIALVALMVLKPF